MQKALFGAGCFWGVELAFRKVLGVTNVTVGYSGGHVPNPTYQEVCYKDTGHAEAVLVEFDESQVSYNDLLKTFWQLHDPTQKNRQGPDIGSQYRSAIFYFNETQKQQAEAAKAQLAASGKFSQPIVTEITPASEFYPAEEYHQRYFEKQGRV